MVTLSTFNKLVQWCEITYYGNYLSYYMFCFHSILSNNLISTNQKVTWDSPNYQQPWKHLTHDNIKQSRNLQWTFQLSPGCQTWGRSQVMSPCSLEMGVELSRNRDESSQGKSWSSNRAAREQTPPPSSFMVPGKLLGQQVSLSQLWPSSQCPWTSCLEHKLNRKAALFCCGCTQMILNIFYLFIPS